MSTETEIASFLGRYTPEIAQALQAARRRLQARFPRGYELVYDNYNALVFGFGPSERASEAILSVAGYPRWITLFFLHGVELEDPAGILEGSGAQVRSVRLDAADHLDAPAVRALIDQAIDSRRVGLDAAPPLTTVIKSVSEKQRPRRPSPAARGRRTSSKR